MFDLAIDSELRGCDAVRLKGMTVDRAMVRERETGLPVRSAFLRPCRTRIALISPSLTRCNTVGWKRLVDASFDTW